MQKKYYFVLPFPVTLILLMLVEQKGEARNPAEFPANSLALELVGVINQWPNQKAWLDFIPLFQPLREWLASLPPASAAAAKEQGSQGDVWQTAEMLLRELPKLGWPEAEPFDLDEAFALLVDSKTEPE